MRPIISYMYMLINEKVYDAVHNNNIKKLKIHSEYFYMCKRFKYMNYYFNLYGTQKYDNNNKFIPSYLPHRFNVLKYTMVKLINLLHIIIFVDRSLTMAFSSALSLNFCF